MMQKLGRQGYELVNVVYDQRQKVWHSFYKKLFENYGS